MLFPIELIQKIQYDYIGNKWRDGIYVFQGMEDDTINIILKSFIDWAKNQGAIKNDTLDLKKIILKEGKEEE
jgi:hypothetical protein